MYNCIKCNKKFNFESKYNEHINRKTPCNGKKELKCLFCKMSFVRPSHKIDHEKTKKHLNNVFKETNNQSELNKDELKSDNKLKNQIDELNNIIDDLKIKNNKLTDETNQYKIKNNELQKENELLIDEINILKINNSCKLQDNEQIYIVHERSFVISNINIYKIGRTADLSRRMKEYTKGSKLLYTSPCLNSIKMEAEILKYLKSNDKYKLMKKYGNEYFQCDFNDLKLAIEEIINNK